MIPSCPGTIGVADGLTSHKRGSIGPVDPTDLRSYFLAKITPSARGTRGWFSYRRLEIEALEALTILSFPIYPQGDSDLPPGSSDINENCRYAKI